MDVGFQGFIMYAFSEWRFWAFGLRYLLSWYLA